MGISVFPAVGGVTQRTTDFTSSGTWVCPAGVYSAEFLVVGAGGGGGGAYCDLVTQAVGSGGGGGGAVKTQILPTTPGASYTITVGAKGTGATNDAGVNGGYSEVVLSGSTLIRSFGGLGGTGIDTTPSIIRPNITAGGGGGGYSTTATAADDSACSGGGGGGLYTPVINGGTLNVRTDLQGSEGRAGATATTTPNSAVNIKGGVGINGFGNGGNGANWNSAATADTLEPPYGAGFGGVISNTTGASNGGNATIAGCGGGGACVVLTAATGSTGGDGADGLVRITYFA